MLNHVLTVMDLLDSPQTSGDTLAEHLRSFSVPGATITVTPVTGEGGSTDFVRVVIPGSRGKCRGGTAPTLGIIRRLGGAGARPEFIGYVSDGDGAAASLAAASKLLHMAERGDILPGDTVFTTHVTTSHPHKPNHPLPLLPSPL